MVTGSSGFIGSHLVRALVDQGNNVMGLGLRRPDAEMDVYPFEECDLLDRPRLAGIISDFSPDAVAHLAARSDLDEKASVEGYAANVQGVENLIAAIRDTKSVKRCIFTSTQLVCRVGYVPKDDRDYCPNTLYGESKVLSENTVRQEDGGGVEWCIVRPTTVWGPGMNPHYQRFFRMINNGTYFHVGRRPLYKSYGYVRNVAHQYLKLLGAAADEVHRQTFYLADYRPISLRDWADAFQQEMGARPIRTFPEPFARMAARSGDMVNLFGFRRFPFNSFRLNNILTEYRYDLSKTEKVCGETPYSMEQGVSETVRWLRNDNII